jgi:hypothetical protein
VLTHTDTRLYGAATAQAWNRPHPRLTRRNAWIDHTAPLPITEGTVIRLTVEHLASGGVNKPVWLWCSDVDVDTAEVDRWWQMFLRRFDIEHTFRMLKQTLGWTRPRLRDPEAADRWTWPPTTSFALGGAVRRGRARVGSPHRVRLRAGRGLVPPRAGAATAKPPSRPAGEVPSRSCTRAIGS